MYKSITIKAGSGGWGGPLTITPTEVLSIPFVVVCLTLAIRNALFLS